MWLGGGFAGPFLHSSFFILHSLCSGFLLHKLLLGILLPAAVLHVFDFVLGQAVDRIHQLVYLPLQRAHVRPGIPRLRPENAGNPALHRLLFFRRRGGNGDLKITLQLFPSQILCERGHAGRLVSATERTLILA